MKKVAVRYKFLKSSKVIALCRNGKSNNLNEMLTEEECMIPFLAIY